MAQHSFGINSKCSTVDSNRWDREGGSSGKSRLAGDTTACYLDKWTAESASGPPKEGGCKRVDQLGMGQKMGACWWGVQPPPNSGSNGNAAAWLRDGPTPNHTELAECIEGGHRRAGKAREEGKGGSNRCTGQSNMYFNPARSPASHMVVSAEV